MNKYPLHTAIIKRDYEAAKRLLENGADVNEKNESKHTPLMLAAANGELAMAKILLEYDSSIDEGGKHGITSLYIAAERGHIEIVNLLLEHNAYINGKDIITDGPLEIAAISEKLEIVKTLLKHGANANAHTLNGPKMSDNEEICKEIEQYNKNPIIYILENNDFPEDALKATIRFEADKKVFFINAAPEWANLPEYELGYDSLVKECLEAQPAGFEMDLVSICGNSGSFYETLNADEA